MRFAVAIDSRGIIPMRHFKSFRLAAALAALALCACAAGYRKAPEVDVNSLGMHMVRIPAGEFMMGNRFSVDEMARDFPAIERSRLTALTDERPLHAVRITRPFYMEQHELTVGQFRRFLSASGYVPESVADGTGGYGYRRDYDPRRTVRGDAFEGVIPAIHGRTPALHRATTILWSTSPGTTPRHWPAG